ncbi:hypothetical protein HMI54_013482, partial [Coelomomyces lativittatus]
NSLNNAPQRSRADQIAQTKSIRCERLRVQAFNLGLESDFGARLTREYFLKRIARECS